MITAQDLLGINYTIECDRDGCVTPGVPFNKHNEMGEYDENTPSGDQGVLKELRDRGWQVVDGSHGYGSAHYCPEHRIA